MAGDGVGWGRGGVAVWAAGASVRLWMVAVLVLVGFAGVAATASAAVYWSNFDGQFVEGGGSIGRANLNGSDVTNRFITGASNPRGLAVDGTDLYWANNHDTTIGRARLDGSEASQGFITGAIDPDALAIDAQNVYWTNSSDPQFTIGRANLDGSQVNERFLRFAAGSDLAGLAVGGGHIYWSNFAGRFLRNPGSIGRANLDGSDVDEKFITGVNFPIGLAIDGPYIYWANSGAGRSAGSIARARLDGTDVDQDFITGTDDPQDVAVDGQRIYWTNRAANTIGRARLNGTQVDQSFITGAQSPSGIAVDCPAPSGQLAGRAIGPVALGVTQGQARQTLPDFDQIGYGFDDFCLIGGFGIRAGYPSAKLLRGLSAQKQAQLRGRIVIALTANPRYVLDGVRAGMTLAAARRKLSLAQPFRIGQNNWYIVSRRAAAGVLKVRLGKVEEVGITERLLVQTRVDQQRLLSSFGAGQ